MHDRRPRLGFPSPRSLPQRPPPRVRDPRPYIIGGGVLLVAVVIALLFIGPFKPFNPSNRAAGNVYDCTTVEEVPPVPDGLERASDFHVYSNDDCNRSIPEGAATLTIPLEDGKSGRGLALYTYGEERWQRVAAAELTEDGRSARVMVDRIPANGAVLRRSPDAVQLMGVTPAGGALHPEAERLATVVGGADLTPAADGSVNGAVTNLRRGDAALLVPVVVTPGAPEADAVNAIAGTADRRSAHAAALARVIQSNRADGVELAYTNVNPARRSDFTELVRAAADAVHGVGGVLILTLPAPTRQGDTWNTGAYDWQQLGRLADYIKVVPEADQTSYRRTVPEMLSMLTRTVDSKKLILQISSLSAEKTDQGIRTMSTLDALSLAAQITVRDRDRLAPGSETTFVADNLGADTGGAGGLNWDAITATVSFAYRAGEQSRQVWIENQYSAAFKAEFVTLWNLGGIAVDNASDNAGLSPIWPGIAPLVERTDLPLVQPNGNMLKPEWQVNGKPIPSGRNSATYRIPPEGGNQTVSLIVSDGVIRVASSTRLTLQPGTATGTATPSTATTTAPGATATRPAGAATVTPAVTATPTVRR